jgi:hypothetical protein
MKRITLLLAVITLLTTNCEYLRKKGIIGKKKRMLEYIERLENTLRDDSIEFSAQIEKIKKDAQERIDSIQNACKNGNYCVITGSFRNPLNADNFVGEMSKMGYKSQVVVAPNGFNLVSAFSSNSLNEALNALQNLRTNVNQESWIYVKN